MQKEYDLDTGQIRYQLFLKPFLDFFVALFLIVLLLPLLLILMMFLFLYNGRSVFFTQERPGKNGKIFKIIKFKTMNDRRDSNGKLLPDELRLTKIGIIIRKLSLDELPQLINVIMGDMSIVGPRPLLTSYLSRYNEYQNRRHKVKPGITGLAQVNGRNAITWDEKFDFDVEYVQSISFKLDVYILYKTVFKVLKREGVNFDSSTQMEPF